MVNTRGTGSGHEKVGLDVQLKIVQHQLKRSQRKLELVLEWIQDSFGETNFLFNDLWKLIREFDEESGASASGLLFESASAESSQEILLQNSTFERTDVRSNGTNLLAKSNSNNRRRNRNPTPPIDKERISYVLVEKLEVHSQPPSILVLPRTRTANRVPAESAQSSAQSFARSTISESILPTLNEDEHFGSAADPARQTATAPRRPRKLPHKLREALDNGDEVSLLTPSSTLKEDEGEIDLDANSADPLRLSPPSSPSSSEGSNSSCSKYKPDDEGDIMETFSDVEPEQESENSSNIDESRLFSCADCDKKFLKYTHFAKHKLIHNTSRDTKIEVDLDEPSDMEETLTPKPLYSRHKTRQVKLNPLKKIKRKPRESFERAPKEPNTSVVRRRRTGRPRAHAGPYVCEICGKVLKDHGTLRSHIKRMHEETRGSFPCTICDKVLSCEATLRSHTRLHIEEKAHLCSVCGKSFARGSTLSIHMMTHSEERNFKCPFCESTFRQVQGLRTHMNRHMRRLEKVCQICGLAASSSSNLKRHISSVHMKERPHKCPTCGKAFKEPNHLKYHIKTHSNPNTKNRGLNREREDWTQGSKRGQSTLPHRRIPEVQPEQSLSETFKLCSAKHSRNRPQREPVCATEAGGGVGSTLPTTLTLNEVQNSQPEVAQVAEIDAQPLATLGTVDVEMITEMDAEAGQEQTEEIGDINNWLLSVPE